jgi:hypothetical protein
MNARFASFVIMAGTLVAAFFMLQGTAQAEPRSIYRGGTYWGSVRVEPNQVVEGDLTVFFGNAEIEGTVDGDVNVVGGNIDVRGGTVNGQTHDVGGSVVESLVPWAPDASYARPYEPDGRLWWRIAWDVVVLVIFLIFPVRARMALGRVEAHPGLATAAGLFGWVAVFPVAILLAITLILIPLIPVEFVLLLAGTFIGHAALALLIGRRFYEMLQPKTTPSPLVALVLGLALLTAAELVPVVGTLVLLLVALVGLGAVILTFVPEAPSGGPGMPPPRQTISGPPMPVA